MNNDYLHYDDWNEPKTDRPTPRPTPEFTRKPTTLNPDYWNWLTSRPKITTRRPYHDDDFWWLTDRPKPTTKRYDWWNRADQPTTRLPTTRQLSNNWDWMYTNKPKTTERWYIPDYDYNNDSYSSSSSSGHVSGAGVGVAVGASVLLFILFIFLRVYTCKRRLQRMNRSTLPTTISSTVVQPSRVRGPQLGNTRTLIRVPSTVTRQQNGIGSQATGTGNGRWMIIRIRRVFCFRATNPYSTLPEPQSPPPYTPENEAPPSYETSEGAASGDGSGVNVGEARTGGQQQNTNEPPPEYRE